MFRIVLYYASYKMLSSYSLTESIRSQGILTPLSTHHCTEKSLVTVQPLVDRSLALDILNGVDTELAVLVGHGR